MARDALRDTDAQAAIGQRDEPAERHGQCPDPHPWHQRMVVEANDPAAVAIRVSQSNVQVGHQVGSDAGRGRLLLAYRIEAPLAEKPNDELAVTGDVESAAFGFIIRA